MSSGPTCRPMLPWVSLRCGQAFSLAATVPSMMSEWPPRYFVPAWSDMSAPRSSGRQKSGVAQVLSQITVAPRCMRDGRDGRHVLHLEGERARRLEIDGAGPLAEQRRRCRRRSAGRRRWSRCRAASAPSSAKMPRRRIDAIGHQEVIAGRQAGEEGGRDRRQAGRAEHRAGRAFQLADRRFQRLAGRRAAPPVDVALAAMDHVVDACRTAPSRRGSRAG